MEILLLDWALIFLVLALVAGVLGFGGVARESSGIAKILFIVFLVIYLVTFVSRNRHHSFFHHMFGDKENHSL